jgi:hypothetical protein
MTIVIALNPGAPETPEANRLTCSPSADCQTAILSVGTDAACHKGAWGDRIGEIRLIEKPLPASRQPLRPLSFRMVNVGADKRDLAARNP